MTLDIFFALDKQFSQIYIQRYMLKTGEKRFSLEDNKRFLYAGARVGSRFLSSSSVGGGRPFHAVSADSLGLIVYDTLHCKEASCH